MGAPFGREESNIGLGLHGKATSGEVGERGRGSSFAVVVWRGSSASSCPTGWPFWPAGSFPRVALLQNMML